MKNKNMHKPPGWRLLLSIGMGIGLLIFFIIWLAFFAGDYNAYQNIAIVLISILVVFLIIEGSWGLKFIPKEGKEEDST